jgi:pSer/pThr/pTyr-binding forkhead associated (FHA) protein
VPYLIVRRDGRVEREVELGATDLRIGREPENDLVLEDTDRGVSRFHAEIRSEGAHCTITDLDSINGTWIGAQRITATPLSPGTIVTVGPYTLELQVDPMTSGVPEDHGTDYTVFNPVAAAPAVAAPPAGAATPTPRMTPGRSLPNRRRRQALLFLWAAIVVACLVGVALYRGTSGNPSLQEQFTPPNPPLPGPVETRKNEVSEHLSGARRLMDAGDLDAVRRELDVVSTIDPDNQDAKVIREQLDAAVAKAATQAASRDQPARRSPSEGRRQDQPPVQVDPSVVRRRPGESQTDTPVRNPRDQDHRAEGTAPKRADGAPLAISRMTEGRRAEKAGELATALQHYQKAYDADPALSEAGATIEKLQMVINAEVDRAYSEARVFAQYKRKREEIGRYEHILKLLPRGDPRRTKAEEQWAILRGGK